MEQRDQELEYYRATVANQLANWQETHRSVIEFAIFAVKAAMLVNGGAAIALLAFLGNFAQANSPVAGLTSFVLPIYWFTAGVFAAALGAGFGYFTQLDYLHETGDVARTGQAKEAPQWHGSTISIIVLAYICFGIGVWQSVDALIGAL